MDLFVTCAKGLEPLLAEELESLGYSSSPGFRGVNLKDVSMDAIYRINYQSRIATRVLLHLHHFQCYDSKSLYNAALKIDWQSYVPMGKTIAIDSNVSHPKLRNSLFAAQVLKDAICDQLKEKMGERPNVNIKNPDIQLNLYIYENRGVISFDTSGDSLGKRGYRHESVEAPMQENLAAALLTIARYRGTDILCDPCCGSGTLLIEAALIASKTAPGYLRTKWGFQSLPEYDEAKWLDVKNQIDAMRVDLPKNCIFGSDINKQAVHAATVNLRSSGFHRSIDIIQSDVSELNPKVPPTLVITNPPYGVRLEGIDHLCHLYREIGHFMKRKMATEPKPTKGFVLTGSPLLAKEVGLHVSKRHIIFNGGIEARLLEFDIYKCSED